MLISATLLIGPMPLQVLFLWGDKTRFSPGEPGSVTPGAVCRYRAGTNMRHA